MENQKQDKTLESQIDILGLVGLVKRLRTTPETQRETINQLITQYNVLLKQIQGYVESIQNSDCYARRRKQLMDLQDIAGRVIGDHQRLYHQI
ncbi:MAG: hypothetical protein WC438_04540 [Candidatus Pacearchaeota archaeon]